MIPSNMNPSPHIKSFSSPKSTLENSKISTNIISTKKTTHFTNSNLWFILLAKIFAIFTSVCNFILHRFSFIFILCLWTKAKRDIYSFWWYFFLFCYDYYIFVSIITYNTKSKEEEEKLLFYGIAKWIFMSLFCSFFIVAIIDVYFFSFLFLDFPLFFASIILF